MNQKITIGRFALMFVAFAFYSFTGVFSKYASMCEFLSYGYILFFCGSIAMLGIYAVLWQIILKLMPLNLAFAFKSITILISLGLAHNLFNEEITTNNIIGATIILAGLITISWRN